jgi:uncharacterized small protein (DUF1192 family)
MTETTHALNALNTLIKRYDALNEATRKGMSEADVVHQFIDDLMRDVLGYPTRDIDRYKYELNTDAGKPDITLTMPNGEKLYIEAKRFGAIKELKQKSTSLERVITEQELDASSIADDRTREEQQAINYAFSNGATWAILTNFERFRLFNARRDRLVLSFETHYAYRNEFDQFMQLSYESMAKGSLKSLENQTWRMDIDLKYLSFINEMREQLAQDLWDNRKDNPWLVDAQGQIRLHQLREVVQRFLDRLVVVRFAEDHLVMQAGQLYQLYETFQRTLYTFSLTEFIGKMFRKFDQLHNSTLFAFDTVDKAVFGDKTLGDLIRKLYEVRYRSMTADILGNTYEKYLSKALQLDGNKVVTRNNFEVRKKQGTYYTPTPLVQYLVDTTLGRYLYATEDGTPNGNPVPDETPRTWQTIGDVTVLDAACGSGSFLIYAYQVLAGFYQRQMEGIRHEIQSIVERMGREGANTVEIGIAVAPLTAMLESLQEYPHRILERHLYGVDLDPQASELASVNLILRALERQGGKKQLPLILNQNVKTGNGLVGMLADDPRLRDHAPTLATLMQMRLELRSVDHLSERHATLLSEIARLTAELYTLVDYSTYFTNPEQVRPFHWGIEFPEIFYNQDGTLKDGGGFTVVVGNPPWEVVKPDVREFYAQFDELIESKYNRQKVEQRIAELNREVPTRQAEYESVAQLMEQSSRYYHTSKAFKYQGGGDTATHKLFTERAFGLLGTGGRLGYLIPSGIYTDLGTKPLREWLMGAGRIEHLYSFSNERFFFPEVDHRFKFVLIAAQKGVTGDRFSAAFRFNPRVAIAPKDLRSFLANRANLMEMRYDTIKRFSPDSLSIMEFQSSYDYEIAEKLYGAHPLLGEQRDDTWNVKFSAELHMTNDRDLFYQSDGVGRVPLYEGKMFHQFNPYFAKPQYWVNEAAAAERVKNKTGEAYKGYRLAFRDIAAATNERTLIVSMLPQNVFAGNKAPVVSVSNQDHATMLYFLGVMNSFAVDSLIRQKVSTTMNFFYVYSLPIPRLASADPRFAPIVARSAWLVCHDEKGMLWEDFKPLWESVQDTASGIHMTNRSQVSDELDALVAHLYGLSKDDYAHILKSFPLVFPNTPQGEAKLSDTLKEWDRMR